MIRNIPLFTVALLAAAAGAISRHGASIDNTLGLDDILSSMPDYRLFAGLAALIILAGFLPLGRKSAGVSKTPELVFQKENLATLKVNMLKLASQADPDIPLLVDYTIYQAIEANASDIHFDPGKSGMILRFRIEGLMTDVLTIPPALTSPITNRFKVMSNVVVYRDAIPQDGRLGSAKGLDQENAASSNIRRAALADSNFRIAFMPTLHGERIVIRILGRSEQSRQFEDLGMDTYECKTIRRLLDQPQGMIVLTGPTGSGKSTTIYTALDYIRSEARSERSMATLEDPIEMDIQGINQSQVDDEKGFTFEKGLRAILRQDPDVIMVGEIRDPQTAKIAIQAGMTGHLLITTVHAGSTAAGFSRLQEMDVASFALNSSVTAIIAQRLVREICPHCRRERGITEHDYEDLRMVTPPPNMRVFYGAGCIQCNETGYLGRRAIYEIMEVTEKIRKLITDGAPTNEIHKQAVESGMRTLWNSGLVALKSGMITPEELSRAVPPDQL